MSSLNNSHINVDVKNLPNFHQEILNGTLNLTEKSFENKTTSSKKASRFNLEANEDSDLGQNKLDREAINNSLLSSEVRCGKPLAYQHIKLDFTLIGGVDDNDIVYQKCIDFWKLIDMDPKLKQYKVIPTTKETISKDSNLTTSSVGDVGGASQDIPYFNWKKNEALMTEDISTRCRKPSCKNGSGKLDVTNHSRWAKGTGNRKRDSRPDKDKPAGFGDKKSPSIAVGQLMRQMDDWDLIHSEFKIL